MGEREAPIGAMKVGFLAGYNQALIELLEIADSSEGLSSDTLVAFAEASMKGADQESWARLKSEVIDRLFGS